MSPTMKSQIGFGSLHPTLHFYIANRPPIDHYPTQHELKGLAPGEIEHIVKNTSNHWRKVFNVYAKLLYDWYKLQNNAPKFESWQSLRDQSLFQAHSDSALLFSEPQLSQPATGIHIVAGKTYAASLELPKLKWIDPYFAINRDYKLIVSPYPDYRQLSNARIAQLIELMQICANTEKC